MKIFNVVLAFVLVVNICHAADYALPSCTPPTEKKIPCIDALQDPMNYIGIGGGKGCVWKVSEENNLWSVSLGYLQPQISKIFNTSIFAVDSATNEPSSIHVSGVVNCYHANSMIDPAILNAYNPMTTALQEKKLTDRELENKDAIMLNIAEAIRSLARRRMDYWETHFFRRDSDLSGEDVDAPKKGRPFKEKRTSDVEETELMKIIAGVRALQEALFEPKVVAKKKSAKTFSHF